MSFQSGRVTGGGTYQKPDNVAVDERFYVKIQCNGLYSPLLIYDKTRQCQMHYPPHLDGFREMAEKAMAEKAANGRKTYMKAAFSADGNIRVYPNQTTLLTW